MLTIDIKYFKGQDKKILKIEKGDWIDLYANEDLELSFLESGLVKLGVGMKLPDNYEAHIAPRSSTFKTWGIIQTNGVGVVDNSYSGNDDEWMMPVLCMNQNGTVIKKGDKICQFRIVEKMPKVNLNEVSYLEGNNRGGFGSTGAN